MLENQSKYFNDFILLSFYVYQLLFNFRQVLAAEAILAEKKDNPANFGVGCDRNCICEIDGQVPCPGIVPLPYHMRGKYKFQKAELPEEQ